MNKHHVFRFVLLALLVPFLFFSCNAESVPLISGEIRVTVEEVEGAAWYEVTTEPETKLVTIKKAGETAVFSDIAPGDYTVIVKAVGKDGEVLAEMRTEARVSDLKTTTVKVDPRDYLPRITFTLDPAKAPGYVIRIKDSDYKVKSTDIKDGRWTLDKGYADKTLSCVIIALDEADLPFMRSESFEIVMKEGGVTVPEPEFIRDQSHIAIAPTGHTTAEKYGFTFTEEGGFTFGHTFSGDSEMKVTLLPGTWRIEVKSFSNGKETGSGCIGSIVLEPNKTRNIEIPVTLYTVDVVLSVNVAPVESPGPEKVHEAIVKDGGETVQNAVWKEEENIISITLPGVSQGAHDYAVTFSGVEGYELGRAEKKITVEPGMAKVSLPVDWHLAAARFNIIELPYVTREGIAIYDSYSMKEMSGEPNSLLTSGGDGIVPTVGESGDIPQPEGISDKLYLGVPYTFVFTSKRNGEVTGTSDIQHTFTTEYDEKDPSTITEINVEIPRTTVDVNMNLSGPEGTAKWSVKAERPNGDEKAFTIEGEAISKTAVPDGKWSFSIDALEGDYVIGHLEDTLPVEENMELSVPEVFGSLRLSLPAVDGMTLEKNETLEYAIIDGKATYSTKGDGKAFEWTIEGVKPGKRDFFISVYRLDESTGTRILEKNSLVENCIVKYDAAEADTYTVASWKKANSGTLTVTLDDTTIPSNTKAIDFIVKVSGTTATSDGKTIDKDFNAPQSFELPLLSKGTYKLVVVARNAGGAIVATGLSDNIAIKENQETAKTLKLTAEKGYMSFSTTNQIVDGMSYDLGSGITGEWKKGSSSPIELDAGTYEYKVTAKKYGVAVSEEASGKATILPGETTGFEPSFTMTKGLMELSVDEKGNTDLRYTVTGSDGTKYDAVYSYGKNSFYILPAGNYTVEADLIVKNKPVKSATEVVAVVNGDTVSRILVPKNIDYGYGSLILDVTGAPGAEWYTLRYSKDIALADAVVKEQKEASLTIDPLQAGTYYYEVKAWREEGKLLELGSAAGNFKITDSKATNLPIALVKTDASYGELTLTLNDDDNFASRFLIDIANIHAEVSDITSPIVLSVPKGDWTLRVKALDGEGNVIGTSPEKSVNVADKGVSETAGFEWVHGTLLMEHGLNYLSSIRFSYMNASGVTEEVRRSVTGETSFSVPLPAGKITALKVVAYDAAGLPVAEAEKAEILIKPSVTTEWTAMSDDIVIDKANLVIFPGEMHGAKKWKVGSYLDENSIMWYPAKSTDESFKLSLPGKGESMALIAMSTDENGYPLALSAKTVHTIDRTKANVMELSVTEERAPINVNIENAYSTAFWEISVDGSTPVKGRPEMMLPPFNWYLDIKAYIPVGTAGDRTELGSWSGSVDVIKGTGAEVSVTLEPSKDYAELELTLENAPSDAVFKIYNYDVLVKTTENTVDTVIVSRGNTSLTVKAFSKTTEELLASTPLLVQNVDPAPGMAASGKVAFSYGPLTVNAKGLLSLSNPYDKTEKVIVTVKDSSGKETKAPIDSQESSVTFESLAYGELTVRVDQMAGGKAVGTSGDLTYELGKENNEVTCTVTYQSGSGVKEIAIPSTKEQYDWTLKKSDKTYKLRGTDGSFFIIWPTGPENVKLVASQSGVEKAKWEVKEDAPLAPVSKDVSITLSNIYPKAADRVAFTFTDPIGVETKAEKVMLDQSPFTYSLMVGKTTVEAVIYSGNEEIGRFEAKTIEFDDGTASPAIELDAFTQTHWPITVTAVFDYTVEGLEGYDVISVHKTDGLSFVTSKNARKAVFWLEPDISYRFSYRLHETQDSKTILVYSSPDPDKTVTTSGGQTLDLDLYKGAPPF